MERLIRQLGGLFDTEDTVFEEGNPQSVGEIPLWVDVPGHPWKVLPVGLWSCPVGEFKRSLVDAFPHSEDRSRVYSGFLRLRSYLDGYSINGWHWVSGTFVTTKDKPADLDITTFFESSKFDRLPGKVQKLLKETFGDADAGIRDFYCDTAYILAYPKSDPLYNIYRDRAEDKAVNYSRTNLKKTGVEHPRGFLRLPLDGDYPPGDRPDGIDSSQESPGMTSRDTSDDDPDVLRHEIDSIIKTRIALEKSGDTRASTQFWILSLRAEQERAQRRLRTVELVASEHDGEIVWEGGVASQQRMDINIYISMLSRIQKAIKFLSPDPFFTIQFGTPQPGSYRLPFFVVEQEMASDQLKLLNVTSISPVDILASILDDDAIQEDIVGHLDKKMAQKNYAHLMKQMADNNLTLEIRTKTVPYGGRITPKFATKRKDWFDIAEVTVENIVVSGILQTGTTVAGSVKLMIDDHKRITLKVDNARARFLVGIPLGAVVRARVERVKTEHPELHTPQLSHRLISIEVIQDQLSI